jgi:hypothetical protein
VSSWERFDSSCSVDKWKSAHRQNIKVQRGKMEVYQHVENGIHRMVEDELATDRVTALDRRVET